MMDTAPCQIHGVDETYTSGESYKACGECWHVWQTEDEFRRDVTELYGQLGILGAIPFLDQVYACPLCAHDF